MDKILQQLLEGQNKIVNGQAEIVNCLEKIEDNVHNIEAKINNIEAKVNTIEGNIHNIEATVNKIEEGQQKDVVAMLERTATKNDMATLSASIAVLNERTFQQETKLRLIETSK